MTTYDEDARRKGLTDAERREAAERWRAEMEANADTQLGIQLWNAIEREDRLLRETCDETLVVPVVEPAEWTHTALVLAVLAAVVGTFWYGVWLACRYFFAVILLAVGLHAEDYVRSPGGHTYTWREMNGNVIATTHERTDRSRLLWLASIGAYIAGTTADAYTSYGKYESNQALRGTDGRFGARGVSIKAAIAGGMILTEVLMRKDRGVRRVATWVNFGSAGLYGAAAAHNGSIHGR